MRCTNKLIIFHRQWPTLFGENFWRKRYFFDMLDKFYSILFCFVDSKDVYKEDKFLNFMFFLKNWLNIIAEREKLSMCCPSWKSIDIFLNDDSKVGCLKVGKTNYLHCLASSRLYCLVICNAWFRTRERFSISISACPQICRRYE